MSVIHVTNVFSPELHLNANLRTAPPILMKAKLINIPICTGNQGITEQSKNVVPLISFLDSGFRPPSKIA